VKAGVDAARLAILEAAVDGPPPVTDVLDLPTTGTWRQGQRLRHLDAATGEPAEWIVTASGTFETLARVTNCVAGSAFCRLAARGPLVAGWTVVVIGLDASLRTIDAVLDTVPLTEDASRIGTTLTAAGLATPRTVGEWVTIEGLTGPRQVLSKSGPDTIVVSGTATGSATALTVTLEAQIKVTPAPNVTIDNPTGTTGEVRARTQVLNVFQNNGWVQVTAPNALRVDQYLSILGAGGPFRIGALCRRQELGALPIDNKTITLPTNANLYPGMWIDIGTDAQSPRRIASISTTNGTDIDFVGAGLAPVIRPVSTVA
jgi:hypothetical protein